MPRRRNSKKTKNIEELLKQSDDVINRSREILRHGDMLSQQIAMLNENSISIIAQSQKIIGNGSEVNQIQPDGN